MNTESIFRETHYQILRRPIGYDLLFSGEWLRSFEKFEYALVNVASRLDKSPHSVIVAPQEDDPYLSSYDCPAGTVFVTDITREQILERMRILETLGMTGNYQ